MKVHFAQHFRVCLIKQIKLIDRDTQTPGTDKGASARYGVLDYKLKNINLATSDNLYLNGLPRLKI